MNAGLGNVSNWVLACLLLMFILQKTWWKFDSCSENICLIMWSLFGIQFVKMWNALSWELPNNYKMACLPFNAFSHQLQKSFRLHNVLLGESQFESINCPLCQFPIMLSNPKNTFHPLAVIKLLRNFYLPEGEGNEHHHLLFNPLHSQPVRSGNVQN